PVDDQIVVLPPPASPPELIPVRPDHDGPLSAIRIGRGRHDRSQLVGHGERRAPDVAAEVVPLALERERTPDPPHRLVPAREGLAVEGDVIRGREGARPRRLQHAFDDNRCAPYPDVWTSSGAGGRGPS